MLHQRVGIVGIKTRYDWHPGLFRDRLGFDFRAHLTDRFRGRADEHETGICTGGCKTGVFR